MQASIVVVDAHRIVRDGLRAILHKAGEFTIVGEAERGLEAVQICKDLKPDLVLMGAELQGLNGIEAARELSRHLPNCKVVMLSAHDDESHVVGAIRSGARAFVLRSASEADLVEALRTVAKGGSYLSPQVSDRLLRRIRSGEVDSGSTPSALESLTARELQVMRLVAEGHSSKEVAELLSLGLQTVRSYRKTLMKKLGVRNAAGLTQLAMAAGLAGMALPRAGHR